MHGATAALAAPLTVTHQRAADALPPHGTLLDVGAGGGASSLPIAGGAGRLIAVDAGQDMLDALRALAPADLDVHTVRGRWPDVHTGVEMADVAVCGHVVYNVADLGAFVTALTEHASRRVVLELTEVHPQSRLSPLWRHFWNIDRPTTPTARDAIEVVTESVGRGVQVEVERWIRPDPGVCPGRSDEEIVAIARRRLCLPATADPEIAELLGPSPRLAPSEVVTVWWPA
ncbi:MAG TPA: class I SAM-dependent methyltransferase [Acidimicrobiales bacterium]|nr:class I SAM-dependent methyltransferase [Acidimicrobiales bacterium]